MQAQKFPLPKNDYTNAAILNQNIHLFSVCFHLFQMTASQITSNPILHRVFDHRNLRGSGGGKNTHLI